MVVGAAGLFCDRVLGQLLVAFFSVSFLPPMEEWYSGALAYPPLLASQILIILLYGKVALDFTRCRGFFTRSWIGESPVPPCRLPLRIRCCICETLY
jgi:hypothetical protein